VIVLGALPWFWWTSRRPPETGGYLEQVSIENRLDPTSDPLAPGSYLERVIFNIDHYARTDFPQLFWPMRQLPAEGPGMRPPPAVRVFSLLIGGILLAFGIVAALRARRATVWDLYGLATLGILALWAWTGDRFFLTLAPLLYLYVLVGAENVSRLLTRSARSAQVAVAALVAVMAIGALREIPSQWRFTRAWLGGDWLAGYQPFWQDYFEVADWIGHEAPDAVIVARKPTFAWYFSGGRPSFVYPFHGDPDATWLAIRSKGATHIIVEPMTRDFLARALAPHIDELEVVHAGPNRIAIAVRIAPPPRAPTGGP
jgi:hypothetical protein